MKITFIRHGATMGNLEKRYIGITDEPLCNEGRADIQKNVYPEADIVLCSPMIRCIQTAKLIYPDIEPVICENLKECNFGDFEGKNYRELNGNSTYQEWIDSGGKMQFPNGENPTDFRQRSCDAFLQSVKNLPDDKRVAFVVHGGTIMSVLSRYAFPKRDYYDYRIENGCGFYTEFDGKKITVLTEFV